MSNRERKKRRVKNEWFTVFGSVAQCWMRVAKLPRKRIDDELYVPFWALDLYRHLLPDEPPATEAHMKPMFQIGEALRSGVLAKSAVEAAHRLGGPEAVAALAAGLP